MKDETNSAISLLSTFSPQIMHIFNQIWTEDFNFKKWLMLIFITIIQWPICNLTGCIGLWSLWAIDVLRVLHLKWFYYAAKSIEKAVYEQL